MQRLYFGLLALLLFGAHQASAFDTKAILTELARTSPPQPAGVPQAPCPQGWVLWGHFRSGPGLPLRAVTFRALSGHYTLEACQAEASGLWSGSAGQGEFAHYTCLPSPINPNQH
jgi:hypothetical protein